MHSNSHSCTNWSWLSCISVGCGTHMHAVSMETSRVTLILHLYIYIHVYATTELHQLRPVQLYYAPCHNFITIHHAVNIYTNVVRCWLVWLQLRGEEGRRGGTICYSIVLLSIYLSVRICMCDSAWPVCLVLATTWHNMACMHVCMCA